jgi:small conductance mechanosensitive channel
MNFSWKGKLLAEPGALTTSLESALDAKTVAIAKLSDVIGNLAVNLTVSILILAVALWLSGWVAQLVRRAIGRIPRINHDQTLSDFASSFARYVVVAIGVIAVLRRLGVETTSIITVLGAASLAVGLALQGTLSNVAAGVMVLIFRPYRVGDAVTVAGCTGTVRHFDLFHTELRDRDNLKVVVPNGKAFGDVVTNYTDLRSRRIELVFGIGYDDDIDKALAIALECAAADDRISADPTPWARVTALSASTVDLTLRAWTAPGGWENARSDLIKRVKEAYDAAGISFPPTTQLGIDWATYRQQAGKPVDPAAKSHPGD